jgi:hypothetical protein
MGLGGCMAVRGEEPRLHLPVARNGLANRRL